VITGITRRYAQNKMEGTINNTACKTFLKGGEG
jgi:hypothetical protein